jgi:tRNA threonylcarbamoyladenosine modification (KEOPS) complex  Pcc1 subunit
MRRFNKHLIGGSQTTAMLDEHVRNSVKNYRLGNGFLQVRLSADAIAALGGPFEAPLLRKGSGNFETPPNPRRPRSPAIKEYEAIAIDEAYTFPSLAEWTDEMANCRLIVEVSVRDANALRETFQSVLECMQISAAFRMIDGTCSITGLPAPFSALHNGTAIPVSRHPLARMTGQPSCKPGHCLSGSSSD